MNPSSCGLHQTWDRCGAICEGKCNELNNTQTCTHVCIRAACACNAGFYRTSDGRCVAKSNCGNSTKICGTNEVWNNCGAQCEGNCRTLNSTSVCSNVFKSGACACRPGFYRNIYSQCVQASGCVKSNAITCSSLQCRTGFECKEQADACLKVPCPSYPKCVKKESGEKVPTCTDFKCAKNEVCVLREVHKCHAPCATKPCYPIPECVSTTITKGCSAGEVFTDCLPQCLPTCRGYNLCSTTPPPICRGGCKCPMGSVKNGSGKCVLFDQCNKNPGCKAHETFNNCQTCERKCGPVISVHCGWPSRAGCACVSGYARDPTTKLCVLLSKCPPPPTTPRPITTKEQTKA